MIQIELVELEGERAERASHVCRVEEDGKILGSIYMVVDSDHGKLQRADLEADHLEYLDGLIKTAVHQLFWKELQTGSYSKNDILLKDYFEKYDFPIQEREDECHFLLEDFIEASRCAHG